jgi:hypothetical protein
VAALLSNGLATLTHNGVNIVGGVLHNNMYHLNMTIIRPLTTRLEDHLQPPPLISHLSPLAVVASSDQMGFYTA